jgi:hypothetical protein
MGTHASRSRKRHSSDKRVLPSPERGFASRGAASCPRRATSRPRGANCVRALTVGRPLRDERAQGRPGAGRARGPPAERNAGGSHHRSGRTPGLPCATALRLTPRSPRGPAFLPPL